MKIQPYWYMSTPNMKRCNVIAIAT
jgi:hypothetical protein